MAQDAEAGRKPQAPQRGEHAAPVLVVGLDGSASSWDAFCWAAGEAARSNARLVAVYAVPLGDPVAAFAVPYDYAGVAQALQAVAEELRDEATRRGEELGIDVCFVTAHGDATHALTDVARRLRANLVVVGRSASVLHRLTGSLSHRITSRNDAPVVVVVP